MSPSVMPEQFSAAADRGLWHLDPAVTFLNHGSFGACPKAVLRFQSELRERLEAEPVTFLVRELEGLLDEARASLATFLGARAENLAFVPNATTGVNTVLRSLTFAAGDELLVTNHDYNACRNALEFVAEKSGAVLKLVEVPFPLGSAAEVVERITAQTSARTRLLLISHVTSPTGLIFPLEQIIPEMSRRGIDTLVDGAHAPGMLPLRLAELGAAYYTGNCHKWMCAPKGAGFLYVREDRREMIRPLVISHGANSPRKDRSRFLLEFGWLGTGDPTPFLSVPEAIRYLGKLVPEGWPAIMRRNHALAAAGRQLLCEALEIPPPSPLEMLGSLAAVPLPWKQSTEPPASPLYLDPLQEELHAEAKIEVPVIPWPDPSRRLLRISAHLYNSLAEYKLLAEALAKRKSAYAKRR